MAKRKRKRKSNNAFLASNFPLREGEINERDISLHISDLLFIPGFLATCSAVLTQAAVQTDRWINCEVIVPQ
jgi:hypothetical protein